LPTSSFSNAIADPNPSRPQAPLTGELSSNARNAHGDLVRPSSDPPERHVSLDPLAHAVDGPD
jgi:hypothetical protein